MRLIDADALMEQTQFRLPLDNYIAEIYDECVRIHRENIEEAPTIDAVPVRHGYWITKQTSIGCEYTVCSSCQTDFKFKTNTGTLARLDMRGQNYCPNCGADMRGTEDE